MPEPTIDGFPRPRKAARNEVLLIASGDLRLAANQKCWPAQREMEERLAEAVGQLRA